MKAKRIIIAIVAVSLCAGVFAYIGISADKEKWVSLNEIKSYENFSVDDITEISLREAVDSTACVNFSDADFIGEWKIYFKNIKLKYTGKDDNDINGGKKVIELKTNVGTATFTFVDDGNEIVIDGRVYEINSEVAFPFSETYSSAKERHGEKRPWD